MKERRENVRTEKIEKEKIEKKGQNIWKSWSFWKRNLSRGHWI